MTSEITLLAALPSLAVSMDGATPAKPVMRVAPTPADGAKNISSLVAAHLALATFWWALFGWPGGVWLAPLAPFACLLHQKAISEWLHEAAHWNIVASRRWNDDLSQWLAAIFFFEEIGDYRRRHFRPHRNEGFFRADDPDTAALAIQTRADLVRALFGDLFGVTAVRAIGARTRGGPARPAPPRETRRARAVATLTALLWIGGTATLALLFEAPVWLAVVVYLATLATLFPVFNRLRVYAQHAEAGPNGTVLVGSRTTRTFRPVGRDLLGRWFASSKVLLFHAEHHAHPALPYRQLEHLRGSSGDPSEARSQGRLTLLRDLYRALPAARAASPHVSRLAVAGAMALLALSLAAPTFAQGIGPHAVREVVVVVRGLRTDRGHMIGSLSVSSRAWSEGATSTSCAAPITLGEARCVFLVPVSRRVAFAGIHDEDSNGALRRDFFGLPLEGYAFSNDVREPFEPPTFAAASFEPPDARPFIVHARYGI